MFMIATGGRTGTMAICHGLDRYSDHAVEHEPHPQLLYEAYLKHNKRSYATKKFLARMRFFSENMNEPLGMSWRAPNLLDDIVEAAPLVRLLVLVRHPLEYVLSAHHMRVFQKFDVWDQTRIVPLDVNLSKCSLAERILWHWVGVTGYLIDFAERRQVRLAILDDNLSETIEDWTRYLNVSITNMEGLRAFLDMRPNASSERVLPDGYDPDHLMNLALDIWCRAEHLASQK